jgi:uncharacterized protein YcbX
LTDRVNGVRVTRIAIYPIKSTAGVAVDACAVEAQGLAMDRRWMVVDEHGGFFTGREYPMLTQVRSRVDEDGLRINAPGMGEIGVPVPPDSAPVRPVRVWNDECRAVSAGADVDDWFTELLAARCHLVYMGDTRQRPVDADYGHAGDRVSFADGYPLLLLSEASLADLNTRLPEPVSMGRFRPNLVVDGCEAYEEDGWRKITIGETQLDGAKNCARCVFTTVDPDNGDKHPQLEPLRTLGSYRRGPDGGVLFGQNLIPRLLGTIRVGDVVTVGDHSI